MGVPAANIVTLLMADLADSTRVTAEIGDAAWAALMAAHDRAAREALKRCGGREIERSDGFKVLFERPIDAVRFAFEYHGILDGLERGGPSGPSEQRQRLLTGRVGIHLGEAVLRENSAEDIARGAKPLEVEGLALPAGARVMSLAQGGQTLLTRAAFDLARRAAVGDDAFGAEVRWLAHGPYAFKGFDEPVEVFEVGRTGVAPPPNSEKAHRALRPGEEELLGWRPAPGLAIERRPSWKLEKKLGEGGFGEVWLARHDKTHEARVFKFCFAIERLRALKRELTLFLLIKEALGERPDIQRLYDLNFDEPPYFLEMDYSEGGDLAQWAEERGGIARVPFATRLELVAQVADAAGAAHSLGIIHKDIKPSNVLVDARRDVPHAKLTDFGIGQLADKSILEQIKVSATGFTDSTLAHTELSSRTGTRLYMAPELLAGKLPSIQSDVYSLGVMLYQLVVGDLARPITTDWRERARAAGADALLLDDLAACLAGEPADRLASARDLATRLRTLPQRRRARRRRNLLRASAASSLAMVALLAATLAIANRERTRADELRIARDAAEAATRRVERARSDAVDLLDLVTDDLMTALAPIGQVNLLDPVTTRTLAYFDSLLPEDISDATERQRARSLRQRAEVLFTLGRLDGALLVAEQARDLLLRIGTPLPESKRELARAWDAIGRVRGRQGKPDEAMLAFQAENALLEELVAADPTNVVWRRALSISLRQTSLVLHAQGRLPESRELVRRSDAQLGGLSTTDASDTNDRAVRAAELTRQGRAHELARKLHKAAPLYEEAIAIYDELARSEPSNVEWPRQLSFLWTGMCRVFENKDDFQEASAALDRSLALSERVAAMEPSNAESQLGLEMAWSRIADLHLRLGDPAVAADAQRNALDLKERQTRLDPTNTDRLFNLGRSLFELAATLEILGAREEARTHLDRAHEVFTSLAGRDPTDVRSRAAIASHWIRTGIIHEAEGDITQADEAYAKGRAIIEELAARDPTDELANRTLATSWILLGERFEREGDPQNAMAHYEKALRLGERLDQENRNMSNISVILAAAHARIAGIHFKQARPREGRRAAANAVRGFERVERLGETRSPRVASLFASALLLQGDTERAAPYLDRLRKIRVKDPGLWALAAEHGIEGLPAE